MNLRSQLSVFMNILFWYEVSHQLTISPTSSYVNYIVALNIHQSINSFAHWRKPITTTLNTVKCFNESLISVHFVKSTLDSSIALSSHWKTRTMRISIIQLWSIFFTLTAVRFFRLLMREHHFRPPVGWQTWVPFIHETCLDYAE